MTNAPVHAPRPRVLFSAPSAFMPPALFEDCPFEVVRREIWHEGQLTPDNEAVGWITNTGWSFQLGLPHIHLFPQLRVVITPSTGSDHIRVDDLRAQGLTCQSLLDDRPGLEHIAASAEHAFLLLLNGLRKLPVATAAFNRRLWRRDLEDELRGRELQGRHVGLVGFGRIGRRLARYCGAFGAEVSFFDPHVSVTEGAAVRVDRLEQLFAASDSVVICCTYNAETAGLVGADLLRRLRSGATFVNIARGEIVDEQALAAFIQERPDVQISLDVLVGESQGIQFDSPIVPLVDHNRVVVTPHIGGSSIESQSKAARLALRLMARALGPASDKVGYVRGTPT